jgi:hypothetical protein
MNNSQTIIVPKEWLILTTQTEIIWDDEYNKTFNSKIPMLYEGANLNGIQSFKPWTSPLETVPKLLLEWNQVKMVIQDGFTKRDLFRTGTPMKVGIGLLFEAVFWTNYQPVDVDMIILESLDIKPINIRERLDYILLNPNKFHSFIQLTELFSEMEKLFKKQEVIKKAKQSLHNN